jgi:hypothetical protein
MSSHRLLFACKAVAIGCAALIVHGVASASVFLGPAPYLSFADSPFNGLGFTYFHLEDFEDGVLNTPGATPSAGWVAAGPGLLTDSVDGDDGVVDGTGTGGHSYYSSFAQTALTITFDAASLGGHLPTHAGIVWTDVGAVTGGALGFGPVIFSALDRLGNSIGAIGPFTLGDGDAQGGTAEDRFFGVVASSGISSITIAMSNSVDWEIDHLQYGFQATPLPEPASVALLGAGLLALATCRRRVHGQRST